MFGKIINTVSKVPEQTKKTKFSSGIYLVKNESQRGLYIISPFSNSVHKIFDTLDYKTKKETDDALALKATQKEVDDHAKSIDILSTTKAEKAIVDALQSGIIKQPAVETYSELSSKYPKPQVGWDVLVKDENSRYNWNGSQWVDMESGVYDEQVATKDEMAQLAGEKTLTNVSSNDQDTLSFIDAISRVVPNDRKRGHILTYRTENGDFQTIQYKGGNPIIEDIWQDVNNWEEIIKKPSFDKALDDVNGVINLINVSNNDAEILDFKTAVLRVDKKFRKRGSIIAYRNTENAFRFIQLSSGNPNLDTVWENEYLWVELNKDEAYFTPSFVQKEDFPVIDFKKRTLDYSDGWVINGKERYIINAGSINFSEYQNQRCLLLADKTTNKLEGISFTSLDNYANLKNKQVVGYIDFHYTQPFVYGFQYKDKNAVPETKVPKSGSLVFNNQKPKIDWGKKEIKLQPNTYLMLSYDRINVSDKIINFDIANQRVVVYYNIATEEFVCLGQGNINISYKDSYIYIGYLSYDLENMPNRSFGFGQDSTDEIINNVSVFNIPELKSFWAIDTLDAWAKDYVDRDYDALINRYKTAITNNPFTNIEAIIEEIGREGSELNLPLYKVEIKAKEQTGVPTQKKIIFISNLHGSEFANPITLVRFVEMMLSNDADDTIAALRDNLHWIIVPSANPWGFSTGKRSNHNGVNLNRNFPGEWKAQGTPDDWGDYSGTEPLSENETKVVDAILQEYNDFYIAIDGHAFSGWEELPFTMFWTHSQSSLLNAQLTYIGKQISKYLKSKYESFSNNNDNVGRIQGGKSPGNGQLSYYLSTINATGYGTLLELSMKIFNDTGASGNKEIANANMICLVNVIKEIVNCYPVK